jgi:hypothetical protein
MAVASRPHLRDWRHIMDGSYYGVLVESARNDTESMGAEMKLVGAHIVIAIALAVAIGMSTALLVGDPASVAPVTSSPDASSPGA